MRGTKKQMKYIFFISTGLTHTPKLRMTYTLMGRNQVERHACSQGQAFHFHSTRDLVDSVEIEFRRDRPRNPSTSQIPVGIRLFASSDYYELALPGLGAHGLRRQSKPC